MAKIKNMWYYEENAGAVENGSLTLLFNIISQKSFI